MKLSFIIPSFFPATVFGGTIFYSLDLCKALAERGVEVFVSTTNTNMDSYLDVDSEKEVDFGKNVKVRYYHDTILNRFSFPLYLKIKKDIERSDVVHINAIFNTPTPIALYWANRLNKRIVLSPHGVMGEWILNQGLPFKRWWLYFFIRPYANRIIWHATSEQEREEILSHYPKAKVVVIPVGINVKEYAKPLLESKKDFLKRILGRDIEVDKIIIGMSRLHKKKGFDLLIKTFKTLSDMKDRKIIVLIAGEDEGERENLERLILNNGLQDKVFLLPAMYGEDKRAFLQLGDLFVLPSHNENFGIVIAEALASGTPVITSIHTPWRELISHKCGDWIPNTELDLITSITKFLDMKKEMLQQNAREYAARYDWGEIGEKMLEVYKRSF